jgi:hypothetical protein
MDIFLVVAEAEDPKAQEVVESQARTMVEALVRGLDASKKSNEVRSLSCSRNSPETLPPDDWLTDFRPDCVVPLVEIKKRCSAHPLGLPGRRALRRSPPDQAVRAERARQGAGRQEASSQKGGCRLSIEVVRPSLTPLTREGVIL